MAPSAIPTSTETITVPTPTKALTTIGATVKEPADRNELTPLQAISQGVCLPSIPTFVSFHTHRAWLLSHMAGAFRVFSRKGFTEGLSGHISVRGTIDFISPFLTLGSRISLLRIYLLQPPRRSFLKCGPMGNLN